MADRSDEPLMQHGGETDYDRVDTHLTGGNAGDRHAQSLGLFVWLLTLSAGISGLLFGCMLCQSPAGLDRPNPLIAMLTQSIFLQMTQA